MKAVGPAAISIIKHEMREMNMSLEALKKVADIEREVSEKIAAAMAEAKKIVAETEQAALSDAEAARKNAKAAAAKAVEDVEKSLLGAADTSEHTNDCDALRREAAGRMDTAASLILERVVNG